MARPNKVAVGNQRKIETGQRHAERVKQPIIAAQRPAQTKEQNTNSTKTKSQMVKKKRVERPVFENYHQLQHNGPPKQRSRTNSF